jgi:putative colanic acid biosysnthesis UDP-glucose lipid carrier transferase
MESVISKGSLSTALLAAVRALAPAAVSVLSLYAITMAFGGEIDSEFIGLASASSILSLFLLQPSPAGPERQVLTDSMPIAIDLMLRWAVVFAIILLLGYATKVSEDYSRRIVLVWAAVTPAALVLVVIALRICQHFLINPADARTVVFAGCNELSQSFAQRLANHPEVGMHVSGFFDDRSAERLGVVDNISLLGRLPDLPAYVKQHRTALIFIALPMRHVQRVLALLDELRDTTASIYYVPDIFVFDLIQARTGDILGMPVVAMCETPFYGYRGVVKRLTDLLLAAAMSVILLPLLIAIALLVKATSRGPAIFKQRRYGLDGQEIMVYKFRTMTVSEDGETVQQASRADARITPLGRFLRRYSLDELPQLINVLRGEMSLVGPRPHAVAHNELYRKLIKGYMLRHKVLPGMTGWAQVNGLRGETRTVEQMEARVRYDLEYLRNWSVALDIKILARTLLLMLSDRNAF